MCSVLAEVLDFVKYPGVSNAGSTNHHPIHSISCPHFECFFGRIHIAVSKYRNADSGIIFHLTDKRPVGCALVELCPGSPVDGQGGNSDILQAFGPSRASPSTTGCANVA